MERAEILKVVNLKKFFETERGLLSFLSRSRKFVHAVDGISFDIRGGECISLAGESGCGKTTTARLILRLIEPTSGKIYFKGADILSLEKKKLRSIRREMQMIFQDPYATLNSRMTVFDLVAEPLEVNNLADNYDEKVEKVLHVLEMVELAPPEKFVNLYPHRLSGGERQRVAIARALILSPKLLVADEPVSMLDVSIRVGILNLLLGLQKRCNMSYLFITHDLSVARYVSNRIGIMYLGKIVETGATEDVIKEPLHPYTEALISIVPVPDLEPIREGSILKGEPPSPTDLPRGCRFHPRCPYAKEICRLKEPVLEESEKGHYVACNLK